MAHNLRLFYQKCDAAVPLQPDDSRYVPADSVRGEGDVVKVMAHAIQLSDTPQHILFTGHRGAGKSTELLRLKQLLGDPLSSEPFFVVYFEADREDVDLNDVDFPDILLSIIRQIGNAMRERLQIELRPHKMLAILDTVKDLLGGVHFEKLELDAKIAKITASIKSSPNVRQDIRKALEPIVSNLIYEANQMLDEAVLHLKQKKFRDLVLIVDNLDRIVLRNTPGATFNSHEQLFINRGGQMADLNCHTVYTVPLSLIYSPNAPALKNTFRSPDILPMIKVIEPDGNDCHEGLKTMRKIVDLRLLAANLSASNAFDSTETIEYLCRMSGGHVRGLLILLRSACERLDDLPITRVVAETAVRGMSNDYDRALNRPEYYTILRKIDQSHDLPGVSEEQMLLNNQILLEYLNGKAWYAVHPTVKLLDKFKSVSSEPAR